jgi:hypothetical protein
MIAPLMLINNFNNGKNMYQLITIELLERKINAKQRRNSNLPDSGRQN